MNVCLTHSLYGKEDREAFCINMSTFKDELDKLQFTKPEVFIHLNNDILEDIMNISPQVMKTFNDIYKTLQIGNYVCTDMLIHRWRLCKYGEEPKSLFYNRISQEMFMIDYDGKVIKWTEGLKCVIGTNLTYSIKRLMFPDNAQNIMDVFKHMISCDPINAVDIYYLDNFYFNTPELLHFQRLPPERICNFDEIPTQIERIGKHNLIYYDDYANHIEVDFNERGICNKPFSNRKHLYCLMERYYKTREDDLFEKYRTVSCNVMLYDNAYKDCVETPLVITDEDREDFDLLMHPAYVRHYRQYLKEKAERMWKVE